MADINPQLSDKEQRITPRMSVEPGTTVHIQCDDREIVGTLQDHSDEGVGLQVAEAFQQTLPEQQEIAVTYSMPYGLVSRRAKVCWSNQSEPGKLRLGSVFLKLSEDSPTNYQKLWKQFGEADSVQTAAQPWLALQCAMISGATRGMLVINNQSSGSYTPLSFWPAGCSGSLGLSEAVELALHEQRGVLRDQGQVDRDLGFRVCHVAYPLIFDGRLYGAVALEMAGRAEHYLRSSMRQLQWGAAWLELFARRDDGKKYSPENQQLATVLDLIAVGLEQKNFQDAATAVATELAAVLQCERVSIGFLDGKYIRVRAVSHSAQFSDKANLITDIGLAMDEAMDQSETLVYPPLDQRQVSILHCHEKIQREHGCGSVCTVPFCRDNEVFGAVTLEKPPEQLFDKSALQLSETVASLIGPILEVKRKEDLWLYQRAWLSVKTQYQNLVGPAHGSLKLAVSLAGFMLLFAIFAHGEFRVTADTSLEGEIQRAIAVPFDGFVSEAKARAGDVVTESMVLAKLDDKDLLLEKARLESQHQQYLKEYRDALGQADRSKVSVLQAQLGQVEAQLALNESQLNRVNIKAPFAGVIVSGDLSQKLGAPYQRGEVLFELAPLDAYRVILQVDERDIAHVKVGQAGQLVLAGHAEQVLPFRVSKITPVSEAKEGRNYFRAEAKLEQAVAYLRPGMKGIGKIHAGEHRLVWIWSKNLIDWLRLTFWTWWPDGL